MLWKRPGRWAVAWTVVAASLLMAASARAQLATESSGQQVDAQHSGYAYGAGVVPPLTEAWSQNVGWSNNSVAIDGGHAFAIEEGSGANVTLASIDLASGDVTWSAPLGNDVFGGNANLVLDSGLVFTAVGTAPQNTQNEPFILSAWNEQTGAKVWSDVLSNYSDEGLAYPIVHDGVLYLVTSGTAHAIRESDGSVLWSTDVPSDMMTLAGGTVVIGGGGCNGEAGLNPATGATEWSENTYPCYGGVTSLSSTDGTYLWSPIDEPSTTGQPYPTIYDPTTGAVVGTFPGTGAVAFGYGEAVAVMSPGYQTPDAKLEAFDPASQAVRWSNDLGNVYRTPPLLADGFAFEAVNPGYVTPPADAYVEAFDACTGAAAWQAPLSGVAPDTIIGDLAAGDGYLVVSTDGGLEAFKGSGMPAGSPPNCDSASPPAAPTSGGSTGTSEGTTGPAEAGQTGNGPAAPSAAPTSPDTNATTPPTFRTPPTGPEAPTVHEVAAALRAALSISGGHARIRALLRARGYTTVFNAPAAGVLRVRWIVVNHHRSRLIADATVRLRAQGRTLVRIGLTPLGRQLLRADKRLRMTAAGTFTLLAGPTTTASHTVTLIR